MAMDNDFKKRLREPQMPMRVLLLDDMGDTYKREIEEKIECYISSNNPTRFMQMLEQSNWGWFERYNVVFFDASYVDQNGTSALDAIESLIKARPQMAEMSKVLIGRDIIQFAKTEDLDTRYQIDRTRKLPHIIYGDQNGTKTENMIREIQRQGREIGIEVPTRLPKGLCGKELIDKISPYIKAISANLKQQKELSENLSKDIEGIEPKTEHERRMIAAARELVEMSVWNIHSIRQNLSIMNDYRVIAQANIRLTDDSEGPEKE